MSWLLDANALIALGWPPHEHHEKILRWFRTHAREGWATSALTQAAFVRVIAQPAFSGQPIGIADVAELLLRNTAHPKHRLLALDFGFDHVMGCCTGGLLGHRQVTDAWLLALAIRHRVKLVTFDKGIAQLLATTQERQRHLAILG
ncbi:MAG: PIN domain-containing protein [Burkholderiales bacterium]|nr:PIN domain-containing protein [Burkholderiales bacterium]